MPKFFNVSQRALRLIEYYETADNLPKYLRAYRDSAGVVTIGIGTTVYPDGKAVRMGDTCTPAQAYSYLFHDLAFFCREVGAQCPNVETQNEFDALVVCMYNIGHAGFRTSTLRRLFNAGIKDDRLWAAFAMWRFAGDGSHNGIDDDGDGLTDEPGEKQFLGGLLRRHKSEYWLLRHNVLRFDFSKKTLTLD